jgi:hypothetical protein
VLLQEPGFRLVDRPGRAVGHPFAALVAGMVRYDGWVAVGEINQKRRSRRADHGRPGDQTPRDLRPPRVLRECSRRSGR